MYYKKQLAVAIAALFPLVSAASEIDGTVLNVQGKPVAGAFVEVEGKSQSVKTDKNGQFTLSELEPGMTKLHIFADGFAHLHQQLQLPESGLDNYLVRLNRSAIEVIDVVSAPVHMSVMESAIPVNVISGESLRRRQASTLGDSLEKLAGVNTNYHGGVASTPIIRGLSGPRVLITQNGLDVGDVSRVGPDHSVAAEASTATQIEVLRGPATLFYGSGAIGGVVNVIDGRVPVDNATRGEWNLETSSVNDKKQASFNLTSGRDSVAVYLDGYWRESDDYQVPVAPDADSNAQGDDFTVENSAEKSNGLTLGASYLLDQGYLGFSVEQFNREYGVPGHSHGGENEEHEHEEHDEDNHAEESVLADLEQTRIQVMGELALDYQWFNKLTIRAAMTDYEHAEIEGGSVGTVFENSTEELRADLHHNEFAGWQGGISLHYKNTEISATGSEAFTPPTQAQTLAMALMEEKHIDDVLFSFGVRAEQVKLSADRVFLPHLGLHQHHEQATDEHEHHAHTDAEHTQVLDFTQVYDVEHTFTPVSLSAGLVWDFVEHYNLGISVSRSQRAPSASELLSFGPHIGTRSYEVGALFTLHQHEDESHFELNQAAIALETSNNIDLTLRKTQGDLGFVFNVFYNRVDNFYYQAATGLFAEVSHQHGESGHAHEEEHAHDEHASELPVYLFQSDDVILTGFEAQVAWQINDEFKASAFSDYVRAKLQDGGDLPRTPPLRLGTQFSYQNEQLSAHLDITRYQEQDKVSGFETTTAGYTLVDVQVAYDLSLLNQDTALYLKINNLTDEAARVHTSFLKDLTPRPGRNITAGIRGYF